MIWEKLETNTVYKFFLCQLIICTPLERVDKNRSLSLPKALDWLNHAQEALLKSNNPSKTANAKNQNNWPAQECKFSQQLRSQSSREEVAVHQIYRIVQVIWKSGKRTSSSLCTEGNSKDLSSEVWWIILNFVWILNFIMMEKEQYQPTSYIQDRRIVYERLYQQGLEYLNKKALI